MTNCGLPHSGFEEIAHTADWAIRVWADNMESLFAEAARGMYAISGVHLAEGPRREHSFQVTGPDPESQLVAFLSELAYLAEQEKIGFDIISIQTTAEELLVAMEGAPIEKINKVIKAVTYHNLQIAKTLTGVETEIVFDV